MFNPFLLIARSNNQTPTLTESFLFKPCIIYYPQGDLNAMFSGIKEKFDDRYGVTIHSEKVFLP